MPVAVMALPGLMVHVVAANAVVAPDSSHSQAYSTRRRRRRTSSTMSTSSSSATARKNIFWRSGISAPQVLLPALEGERRGAAGDPQRFQLTELSYQLFGEAIGEVLLLRVRRHVDEGQDRDGHCRRRG